MMVRIFSVQLLNDPGHFKGKDTERTEGLANLNQEVDQVLREHPMATVEFHQSSAASQYGSFTQLTAIVRWP